MFDGIACEGETLKGFEEGVEAFKCAFLLLAFCCSKEQFGADDLGDQDFIGAVCL